MRPIDPRPDRRVLAILGFHKVGEPSPGAWETWYYNTEAEFAGYLRHLHDSDWHVIDAEGLLAGLADPDRLPQRSVLLTFDDGYRSVRNIALPWLVQFGYPAVVFVPSQWIGRGSHAFDANSHEPDEPLCGWDELRELERHGISIQSHGVTHRALSDLGPSEQLEEMSRSKALLEAGLQKSVAMFCYPYGDGGADANWIDVALQRVGYKAACLYDGRVNSMPIANPFRLSRLTLGRGSDLRTLLQRG